jgi:multiple sugar transport system permease protein
MAASVIVAVPLVVTYFVAQRWFIEGLTLTGSKG